MTLSVIGVHTVCPDLAGAKHLLLPNKPCTV